MPPYSNPRRLVATWRRCGEVTAPCLALRRAAGLDHQKKKQTFGGAEQSRITIDPTGAMHALPQRWATRPADVYVAVRFNLNR